MNLPNKITTFRMVCVVIVDFILLFPWKACGVNMPLVFDFISLEYFVAGVLFLIASFSDFLDGSNDDSKEILTIIVICI